MMEIQILDTRGLKCPQPVLKIAMQAREITPGRILEVLADCPTFERDVRAYCDRLGKTIISVEEGIEYKKTVRIRF
jgi:tRNA 2-thiouridine synthesizing protein A